MAEIVRGLKKCEKSYEWKQIPFCAHLRRGQHLTADGSILETEYN